MKCSVEFSNFAYTFSILAQTIISCVYAITAHSTTQLFYGLSDLFTDSMILIEATYKAQATLKLFNNWFDLYEIR